MTSYINPFLDRKHYYEHVEWLAEHIDDFFDDKLTSVFHEMPLLDLRVDVYLIELKNKSYNLLVTSGMSVLSMDASNEVEDSEDIEFAELMIMVPKDIEFSDVYTGDKKNDWIITMLKRTAKFPHLHDTWLSIGHSIQAESDMAPYGDDTTYVGALILPSVTFDKSFTEIHKEGRKINIYTLFPLYEEELRYKIANGYNKFLDLLIAANGKEVLDLNRANLVS